MKRRFLTKVETDLGLCDCGAFDHVHYHDDETGECSFNSPPVLVIAIKQAYRYGNFSHAPEIRALLDEIIRCSLGRP